MGQGDIIVIPFCAFLGKVSSKDRISTADMLGCVVKSVPQITRTTLFHMSIAVCEFYGLIVGGEQPA